MPSAEIQKQAQALKDYSPWAAQQLECHPDWLSILQPRLDVFSPPSVEDLQSSLDEHGLMAGLRHFRNRELLRIIWRDVFALSAVAESLSDISLLAELCLQAAVDYHQPEFVEKYGQPLSEEDVPQSLVVLAMGKLGGGELNLSSDIDLVFCFPEPGETDGARSLSNEQFFTRMARAVIKTLSEVTEEGFCYRVDTRLRPFGDAGPLCVSFAAMELYYQREGRDWERYALIKARPVAGDQVQGTALLQSLKPFVYRRYIDFGAVEALREMQASVYADAARKDRLDDLKRGPGGIREIEFLVQGFQLLRGGREPGLQTPSLINAMAEITRLQLLDKKSSQQLMEDYFFLRRVENRVQALHDRQGHCLPQGEDLNRVANGLGGVAQLNQALTECRQRVRALFTRLYPSESSGEGIWAQRWQTLLGGPQDNDAPAWQGWNKRSAQLLADFIHRLRRSAISQRAEQRLGRFMPILLAEVDQQENITASLEPCLDLVLAISRRSAYLALLVENSQALQCLVALFGQSDWISRQVIRFPALLDELIDPALGDDLPDRQALSERAAHIVAVVTDREEQLNQLNYLKLSQQFRMAVSQLANKRSSAEIQTAQSELAEVLLSAVLGLVESDISKRHGVLSGQGLAVIGYGSLGSREMGYQSDLDLVFLYQADQDISDGEKPLQAERYYTRIAQRMLGLLITMTPAGRLYEVDNRLRPNGSAGLLVTSLDAFAVYQESSAWVWELQALCRARPVAGSPEIAAAFEQLRFQLLSIPRDPAKIQEEIRAMRQRLLDSELDDPLKQPRGGMIDISFVAQLGVLACSDCPSGKAVTDTVGQLSALADCGWLQPSEARELSDVWSQAWDCRQIAVLSQALPLPDFTDSAVICSRYLGL